ncbi:hypothetical protein GCK32_006728, partial [Trichostrongylus colubriformis]
MLIPSDIVGTIIGNRQIRKRDKVVIRRKTMQYPNHQYGSKQQLSVPSLNAVLLDVLKTHSASVNGENFAETKMKEKQASNNCIHLKVS